MFCVEVVHTNYAIGLFEFWLRKSDLGLLDTASHACGLGQEGHQVVKTLLQNSS